MKAVRWRGRMKAVRWRSRRLQRSVAHSFLKWVKLHIRTPLLRKMFVDAWAVKLTHCPTLANAPPIVLDSCKRRSKNVSVSTNSADVSCVMKSSVLEYMADRLARFVYQLVSTLVSPARNQISSDRRASSARDVGMLPGWAMTARAWLCVSCQSQQH